MKIISIIVTLIGLLITGLSSLGIVYSLYTAIESMKSSETNGIGLFAQRISNAQLFGYVNLFGVLILFLGVALIIAAMYTGRKKQVIS